MRPHRCSQAPKLRPDHSNRFSGVTFFQQLIAIMLLAGKAIYDGRLPHFSATRLLKREEGSGRGSGNPPVQ